MALLLDPEGLGVHQEAEVAEGGKLRAQQREAISTGPHCSVWAEHPAASALCHWALSGQPPGSPDLSPYSPCTEEHLDPPLVRH